MLKLIVFFMLFSGYIYSQIAPEADFIEKLSHQEARRHQKMFSTAKSLTGINYDMKYQRFYWEIDPRVHFIKGSVCTYFKPIVSDLLEISFDMTASLICDSVVYHGQHLTPTHLGEELNVILPAAITLGSSDSITVYYHGVPPINGSGSFERAVHGSGADTCQVVWTLSEPYGAKDWMLCKQSLNDKIDSIDVFIQCPAQFKAASNGKLISEQVVGSDKLAHWKHRYPIVTYLIALAVTNYVGYSDWVHYPNGDSLEVVNYVYPESVAHFQQNKLLTDSFINLYNQLLIPYPFQKEKYGHAQCEIQGGMEHQTMTFLGDYEFGLVSHELAHQWFGDYVTCGSWHDIWLNEGFATYFSGIAYERLVNGFYWPIWKTNAINNATSIPDGSVYCTDTTSVNRIFSGKLSYSKGAILLHMLRWELGDSAFFTALRNYLNDPALTNNFAYTPNLIHHLETAGDTSLTEFFNDWFYGEGFPTYSIKWNQNIDGLVTLEISQTQSHASVSFFDMDIPVQLVGTNKDTILRIHHSQSPQIVSIYINFSIQNVIFDPQKWILTRNPVVQNVENITDIDELDISPNPGNGTINISSKTNISIDKIELCDMLGNSVYVAYPAKNSNYFQVTTEKLASGTYILNISGDKINMKRKIVKAGVH